MQGPLQWGELSCTLHGREESVELTLLKKQGLGKSVVFWRKGFSPGLQARWNRFVAILFLRIQKCPKTLGAVFYFPSKA